MSRPIWQRFESVLADPITRYLAVKRSMGCRFNTEDRALRLAGYEVYRNGAFVTTTPTSIAKA